MGVKWTRSKKPCETGSEVNPTLLDLVRLRVCQIYQQEVGIEKHTLDLKARGETEQRLNQLKEWQKSSLFSKKERAALALCEAIVLHPTEHPAREFLCKAQVYFSKEQLISLTLTVLALIDWSHLSASYFWEDEAHETRMTFHRVE